MAQVVDNQRALLHRLVDGAVGIGRALAGGHGLLGVQVQVHFVHVVDRGGGVDDVGNAIGANAAVDEDVVVAIVRHQGDAVAPFAVGGGSIVANHLVHHLLGLGGVVQLAFGQAHRQAAHANIKQLAA